jgi:hypothetical protein
MGWKGGGRKGRGRKVYEGGLKADVSFISCDTHQ